MAISLQQARQASCAFQLAEVESLMGLGYHCHLLDKGERHLLVSHGQEALRLKSLTQVKALLRQLPVLKAELVHRSPYGEMIGQAGGQNDTEMRLPLSLQSAAQVRP